MENTDKQYAGCVFVSMFCLNSVFLNNAQLFGDPVRIFYRAARRDMGGEEKLDGWEKKKKHFCEKVIVIIIIIVIARFSKTFCEFLQLLSFLK